MKNKRVVVSRYGGPEVLQIVEEELPEPRAGEVRLRILAAGVAWGDILKREGVGIGARPPYTPGYDIVGIVDKLGEGVTTVQVGQIAAALPLFGGYAEFISILASELVLVPRGIVPAKAVCLVMNYVVAYQMLHRAGGVKSGECILIHGAAGGVGTAPLHLGKLAGMEMYGTASSGKHQVIINLGATPIDYRTEDVVGRILDLTGDGVDVVFDPVGGSQIWQSYRMLRRGGRLVVYGAHSILTDGKLKTVGGYILGSILNLAPDRRAVMIYNITRPRYSKPEWCREDLSMLFSLLAQEKIEPIIAEQVSLVEAARAHEILGKGAVVGKLVLIPNPKPKPRLLRKNHS